MHRRIILLSSVAALGLLLEPAGAWAGKSGGTFAADNVLWLPEVFATLDSTVKQAVQDERSAEDAVFKKVQKALQKGSFSSLTREELGSILSLSNLNQTDRDLTPSDLSGTGPFAFAGMDRMIGIGVDGDTSFRVDLSSNFLPTLLVPTVTDGQITDYSSLDDVFSIANIVKGKGGAKIAKNGISFDADTGELQVTLKKPFADKQFVNLVVELDDGSSAGKGKGKARAKSSAPSFQVTFANMTNPIADEPIQVSGTNEGGAIVSQAADVEDQVTSDRPDNRAFLVAVQSATGINLGTGSVADTNTSYTAVVSNSVLFKKFQVQVSVASAS